MNRVRSTTLGFPPDTRLVVFTCDEFGECHAANAAIIRAMEEGLGVRPYAVGATLQMPGPWVMGAVAYALAHPQADVGVHLTLQAGKRPMRMRPLCSKKEVPGLYDTEGYFWHSAQEAWAHATEEEVYGECRAQIEAALAMGLDVTHLDGHGGFQGSNNAGYCRVIGTLAEEFRLPVRIAPRWRYEALGLQAYRDEVLARGVVACDDDTNQGTRKQGESWRDFYLRRLRDIGPGLTDFYIHPSLDTDELRALLGPQGAANRIDQHNILASDPEFRDALAQSGVRVVNWRDVRDFQRQ